MSQHRSFPIAGIFSFGILLTCLFQCGCEKSEPISTYTVPPHKSLQSKEYSAEQEALHPEPVPTRMIGVIIPRESWIWFFKLEDEVDAAAAREQDVRDFLKSVRFPKAEGVEDIDWDLPSGWTRFPADQNRYATLMLSGRPRLSMSVTRLPLKSDSKLSLTTQVVANINRWRGQLAMLPIDDEDLADVSEIIVVGGSNAYLVNFIGTRRPMPRPKMQTPSVQQQPAAAEPKFEMPEGWKMGPSNGIAAISLQVVEADSKVAITVTPAGGDLLANVNRWRDQVKIAPLTPDELKPNAKMVEVGKLPGALFEATNGERTIYGVIVMKDEQMWFVKLDGSAALATQERPRFEAFLKSLQLN